jgi:CRISPR type III-A-associated RAMP protein Csm4
MLRLGLLEDWLRDTVQNEAGSQVRFSSLYPFQRDTLFVVPPRGIWPPPPSAKIRYKGAQFVPLKVVDSLLNEKPLDEDRWQVDGESRCLIPNGWHDGPFKTSIRSGAGVDRVTHGTIDVHRTACLEFTRDAGFWMLVVFADDAAKSKWDRPMKSALRWLADSGIGGERSQGWGRSLDPKWDRAEPFTTNGPSERGDLAYWLLSLYTPADADGVDWNRGNYATFTRSGRTESVERWGELKTSTLMIAEGSVLLAGRSPQGSVRDVAPQGFAHPVYRAGFGVAIPIPWRVPA